MEPEGKGTQGSCKEETPKRLTYLSFLCSSDSKSHAESFAAGSVLVSLLHREPTPTCLRRSCLYPLCSTPEWAATALDANSLVYSNRLLVLFLSTMRTRDNGEKRQFTQWTSPSIMLTRKVLPLLPPQQWLFIQHSITRFT